MAQTVEEIAEILNTLKLQNEHNAEGFDKFLNNINNKLDMMAEDNEAVDLIKVYLSELKKSVEDKHSYTISMFNGIEHSFGNILSAQENTAKTSEIRDLFNSLTNNVNAFSSEISSQKDLISRIDDRLEILGNDKSDKNEIINHVSSIKADFEVLNTGIEHSFSNINASLQSAVQNILSLDLSSQNEAVRNELQNVASSVNAILSAVQIESAKTTNISELINNIPSRINLDDITLRIDRYSTVLSDIRDVITDSAADNNTFVAEQFEKLEKELSSIVTDSDFAGFRKDLADFVQKIIDNTNSLSNDLNSNAGRIENILSSINSLDYNNDFENIAQNLNDLKDIFHNKSDSNFEQLIEKLSTVQGVVSQSSASTNSMMYEEFEKLEKSFSNIVTDADFAGFKDDLADFVQKIIDNSSALNSELEYTAERIENILTTVKSLDFREDFDNISQDFTELKDFIGEKSETNYNNISDSLNSIRELISNSSVSANIAVNEEFSRLEKSFDKIVTGSDLVSFKDELNEFLTNISDKTVSLSFDVASNKIRLEDILSSISSLDFNVDLSGVNNNLEDLKAIVQNNAKNNYDNLSQSIEAVKDLVSENSAITGNMIYEEFSKLEKSFANIVTDADFAGFKDDLAEFVKKIIDNSSALNSELEYTAERIENILTTVKSLDFREDFENIVSRVNELKDSFESGSRVNYDNLSREISLLSERFLISFDNLDTVRKETFSSLKSDLENIVEDIKNLSNINPQASIDELSGLAAQISDNVNKLKDDLSSNAQLNHDDLRSNLNAIIANLQIFKDDLSARVDTSSFDVTQRFGNVENLIDNVSIQISGLQNDLEQSNTLEPAEMLSALDDLSKNISVIIAEARDNSDTNYNAIKEYFNELTERVNGLSNEFKQTVSADLENTSKILSKVDNISERIDGLKQDILQIAETDSSGDILISIDDVSGKVDDLWKELSEASSENSSKILTNVDNISAQIENIQNEIKQLTAENSRNIIADINDISGKFEELKLVISGLDVNKNDAEILLNIDDVSLKVDALNDSFVNTASENYEKLQELLGEISSNVQKQKDDLSAENRTSDEEKLAHLHAVSSKISELRDVMNSMSSDYKNLVEEKVSSLRDYMSETSNSLYSSFTDGDSRINEKLASLDELSHGFEASLIDVNVNLQSIIKSLMTMDVTEQNDIIKRELENIYMSSNAVLSALKISDQKNEEIAGLISTLVNKEDYEQSQKRFDEIIAKAQELSANITALPTKIDFANVSDKLQDFSNILMSVKNIVTTSSDTNSEMIGEQFVKFESAFSKIITEEDFVQFRAEFTEFIQRIIDNSTILNFNSEDNKVKISEILEKINTFDYSSDLENIASRMNDIRDCFENNSKMNYENLSNEIFMLSERFQKCFDNLDNERKDALSNLKDDIDNVFSVVKDMSDNAPQKSLEILTGVSNDLRSTLSDLERKFNSNVSDNFENLKNTISKMVTDLNEVKEDFVQKSDMNTFNISTGFDTFRGSIEGITNSFESLKTEILNNNNTSLEKVSGVFGDIYEKTVDLISSMEEKSCEDADALRESIDKLAEKFVILEQGFKEVSSSNAEQILSDIQSVSNDINDIKADFIQTAYNNAEKITDNIDIVSCKLDTIQNNFAIEAANNLSDMKDVFCENVKQFENVIDEKSADYKQHVQDVIESLRNYISELNVASKSAKSLSESKFAEKLLSIEALISHSSTDYDEKLTVLQNKLADYIRAVENASSETDSKIENSANEVNDIKNELDLLSDCLKTNFDSNDEKLTQVVSFIDTGIQTLSDSISGTNASIQAGVNISLKDNLAGIDEKFDNLLSLFDILKSHSDETRKDLVNDLEDKISALKQEINLVNTDIADALNYKSEEIIKAFEPIKTQLDQFIDSDFSKVLDDIKTQLELSYINLNTDLTNGFVENQLSIERLEQAYKETLNKISDIDDCLREQTQDNIELLKLAVENVNKNVESSIDKTNTFLSEWKAGIKQIQEKLINASESYCNSLALFTEDVKNVIDDKLNLYIEDLKSHIGVTLNTDDTMHAIDALKQELSDKFNSLLIDQASRNEKADSIEANVHALGDTLKEYVQSACENTLDKINQTVKDVNAMGTMVNDSNEVIGVIENLKVVLSEEITQRLSKFITIQSDLDKTTTEKIAGLFVNFDQKLEKIKHDVNSFIYNSQLGKEQSEILDEIYALRNGSFGKDKEITPEILVIIDHLEAKIKKLDGKNPHDEYINSIMETNKNQLLVQLSNIKEESENYLKASASSLEALHQKIDMLVLGDEGQNDDVSEALTSLNEKIDLLVLDDDSRKDDLSDALQTLNDKIDVIAADTSLLDLNDKIEDMTITETKISETLLALHQKVDTFALFNDTEDFDAQSEIEEIKTLILEQRKYFENSETNEKSEAINECLEDLLNKIQTIENGLSDVDLEKNTQDIKESIMSALISVFEQVSFVEETEEIKDFVEEKTDEINQHLQEVREQLKQIASADGSEYSYSLQDVETDIAKLRIALSDISNSTSKDEISNLSNNINRIVSSVEGLQSSLTPDQMFDLKEDIEKLNDDIISISARTNKLLLTSDESYHALSSGLDKFSNVVSDLEDKISCIDNSEVNERFERKIDAIKSMVTSSVNSDKVMHKVLMYLGEWIDSTSENISAISEKASEVDDVKNMISELKDAIPDKTAILEELEDKFENQESRIDRLEMKIERILSALEEKDDMMLNSKVDKIEKQLSRLSINIEKLASYVDEE